MKMYKLRQTIKLAFLSLDQSRILIVLRILMEINKQSHLQNIKTVMQILNLIKTICLKIRKFRSFDTSKLLLSN